MSTSQENDAFGEFLRTRIERVPNVYMYRYDFRQMFNEWCDNHDLAEWANKTFGEAVKRAGIRKVERIISGSMDTLYEGVRVREDDVDWRRGAAIPDSTPGEPEM